MSSEKRKIAFIDGKPYEIGSQHTSILKFVKSYLGEKKVPTLCDDPNLAPYGACRVCSVEVALVKDGPTKVVASCHTPVAENQHIFTNNESLTSLRKNIIELVLTDHPMECSTCEVDMSTPMKKIINEIGGGFKEPVKALQIGGPLGGVVPIEEVEKLNLDFQEFTAAGFMLGHGSIVSIPKHFSMVEYIHHLFEFSAEESCGKCFPGRLGSYRGKEMFDQVKNKSAKIPMKLLNELLVTMQKGCLCALCGAIPVPISNILKYFGDEMKNDIIKDN